MTADKALRKKCEQPLGSLIIGKKILVFNLDVFVSIQKAANHINTIQNDLFVQVNRREIHQNQLCRVKKTPDQDFFAV